MESSFGFGEIFGKNDTWDSPHRNTKLLCCGKFAFFGLMGLSADIRETLGKWLSKDTQLTHPDKEKGIYCDHQHGNTNVYPIFQM